MKFLRKIIKALMSYLLTTLQFLILPILTFCFGVVSLSIAGVIAFSILGQSEVGLKYFSIIMNLNNTPIIEPVRIILMTLNWVVLTALIIYCGIFFGSRFIADLFSKDSPIKASPLYLSLEEGRLDSNLHKDSQTKKVANY